VLQAQRSMQWAVLAAFRRLRAAYRAYAGAKLVAVRLLRGRLEQTRAPSGRRPGAWCRHMWGGDWLTSLAKTRASRTAQAKRWARCCGESGTCWSAGRASGGGVGRNDLAAVSSTGRQYPMIPNGIEPWRGHEGGEFFDQLEGREHEMCGAV